MPKRSDLIGQTFGLLTVIELGTRNNGRPQWHCKCRCGNTVDLFTGSLSSGNSTNCGCVRRQKLGHLRLKHGLCGTPEYVTWQQMRARCSNPRLSNYQRYGGRGIRVCDRWNSFDAFLSDMGKRPTLQHSIDRIDVNGHYEPQNCRWATKREQVQNRRHRVSPPRQAASSC